MNRARLISITLLGLGVVMFIAGVLWLWLGFRAARNDPYSGFNQSWPYGTAFIGLLLAAAGASTYRDD